MSCLCTDEFYMNPRDYNIRFFDHEKMVKRIVEELNEKRNKNPSDPQSQEAEIAEDGEFEDRHIEIKGCKYEVSRCIDANGLHRFSARYLNREDEAFQYFEKLLNKETVTISSANCRIFLYIGEYFEIDDLIEFSNVYVNGGRMLGGGRARFKNFTKNLTSFLRQLSVITKAILCLWDLIGVGIVIGFFFNTIILVATMGIVALQNDILLFLFGLLPIMLFTLYFSNIILIPMVEFFKFMRFSVQTPFASVQILGVKLMKVVNPKYRNIKEYFELENIYNMTYGIAFLVFCFIFMLQVVTETASYLIELIIFVFAIILPPIKYFLLIIMYSVHGYVSCFEKYRTNYVNCWDFSDHFLNSLYVKNRSFLDFMDKDSGDEKELENINKSDGAQSSTEEPNNRIQMKSYEKSDRKDSIIRAVFSRNVHAIYVFLGLFFFMVSITLDNVARSLFLVLLFSIIGIPLGTWLDFPFLWISRAKTQVKTDAMLDEDLRKVKNIDALVTYTRNLTIWSKKTTLFRYMSIVIVTIIVFFFLLYGMLILTFINNPNAIRNDDTSNITSIKHILSEADENENQTRYGARNPVCELTIKGLTSLQLIALADASYYDSIYRRHLKIQMFKEYFGDDWEDIIEEIPTQFPDEVYNSSMSHFVIQKLKLIVFSIRGTKTLNDILCDAELWIGSLVMDILMAFVPIVDMYSSQGRAYLGTMISIPRYIFRQFSLVDKFINKYLTYIDNVTIPADYDVLVTGHSLGGGIGKIIGLQKGYQMVAVSGPGISSIESFYKKDLPVMTNIYTNINPAQDIVAQMDAVGDVSEFKIPCRSGIMKCHSSVRTLCQTGIVCGEAKKHEEFCRSRFNATGEYENMLSLVKPIVL